MRRTLLGCCADCVYDLLNERCDVHGDDKQSCYKCKLCTKPVSMGSADETPTPPNTSPYVTCRCLQDATKKEMQTKQCKYKLPKD